MSLRRAAIAASIAISLIAIAAARAADGDLDPSFGTGGIARFDGTTPYGRPVVAADPQGRLVVCDGDQSVPVADYGFVVERKNADGSPDATFGDGGSASLPFGPDGVEELCAAIAFQSDGRIVIAGVSQFPGFGTRDPYFLVVRLTADGALDATFAGGAGYLIFPYEALGEGSAAAVAIDASGRIVVAGGAQSDVPDENFAVARLLPDGTFDATFNGTGSETLTFYSSPSYEYANHVAIDAEGRIVLAGNASGTTALARLLDDGTLDPAFGDGGKVLVANGTGAAGFLIDHAGRLVAAGTVPSASDSQNADFGAVRFFDDGTQDMSFGVDGVASVAFDLATTGGGRDNASVIVEQSDGALVLVGTAEYGDIGYTHGAAARLLPDGSLDASFGDGGRIAFDFGLTTPSNDWLPDATLSGGHVVVSANVQQGDGGGFDDDIVARLESDLVFRATFE